MKYLLRRSAYALFTVWVISLISFAVIQLPPGDYVSDLVSDLRAQAGEVSPEWEQRMREIYGFDDPFLVQYFKWMRNIITKGKFGYSFYYKRDAVEMITEHLPMSPSHSPFCRRCSYGLWPCPSVSTPQCTSTALPTTLLPSWAFSAWRYLTSSWRSSSCT